MTGRPLHRHMSRSGEGTHFSIRAALHKWCGGEGEGRAQNTGRACVQSFCAYPKMRCVATIVKSFTKIEKTKTDRALCLTTMLDRDDGNKTKIINAVPRKRTLFQWSCSMHALLCCRRNHRSIRLTNRWTYEHTKSATMCHSKAWYWALWITTTTAEKAIFVMGCVCVLCWGRCGCATISSKLADRHTPEKSMRVMLPPEPYKKNATPNNNCQKCKV